MKRLIIIIIFTIATLAMGRFILHDVVGDFQTHSRFASFIIYASLMLFSYKLMYFIFDLVYHLTIELEK